MTTALRILFFGIYDIGVCSLSALFEGGYNVIGVVTKPSSEYDSQPVAALAREHKLTLFEPVTPRQSQLITAVSKLQPDLIVVCGYHKRIPKSLLDIPKLGAINLHDSLLPKYRGPNGTKWAIVNGERVTGPTVHFMTENFDSGPILAQSKVTISADDTGHTLFKKISTAGASLVLQTVRSIQDGTATSHPQNEEFASYFSYPTQEDTRIDWSRSAKDLLNLIRAFNPRPGAWCVLNDVKIRVHKASLSHLSESVEPGKIIDCAKDSLTLSTSSDPLCIQRAIYDDGGGIIEDFRELVVQIKSG